MAAAATPDSLAGQARRLYTEELVKGLTHVVQATIEQARALLDKPSEHGAMMRRRDLVQALMTGAQSWHRGMVSGLRRVLTQGPSASRPADLPRPGGRDTLTLVPDDTIELDELRGTAKVSHAPTNCCLLLAAPHLLRRTPTAAACCRCC